MLMNLIIFIRKRPTSSGHVGLSGAAEGRSSMSMHVEDVGVGSLANCVGGRGCIIRTKFVSTLISVIDDFNMHYLAGTLWDSNPTHLRYFVTTGVRPVMLTC